MESVAKTVVTGPSDAVPSAVEIITMTRLQVVVVRAARVYLQTVLGILTAGGVGAVPGVLPQELHALIVVALKLGAAPVVFTVLQNAIELLAEVDSRYPKLRA